MIPVSRSQGISSKYFFCNLGGLFESSIYAFKLLVSFLRNKGKLAINYNYLKNLSFILNKFAMNIQQTYTLTEVAVPLRKYKTNQWLILL